MICICCSPWRVERVSLTAIRDSTVVLWLLFFSNFSFLSSSLFCFQIHSVHPETEVELDYLKRLKHIVHSKQPFTQTRYALELGR